MFLLSAIPTIRPVNCTPVPDMLARARVASSHGGILFADEAFIELADPSETLIDQHKGSFFVLRSLTKSFAVPGIRFGYGFGDPDLVAKIETARPPWSVNAYAEAFALQAFTHMDEWRDPVHTSQKSGVFSRKRFREWACSTTRPLSITCWWTVPVMQGRCVPGLKPTISLSVTARRLVFRPASAWP